MSLRSSNTRYGAVAVAIHWLTALAIIGMLVSGLVASNTASEAQQLTVLRAHAIMGVLVGVLTLFRIVWWLAFDKRPGDVPGMSRLQKQAAHAVHFGLYLVILVMVSSGLGTLVLTGANLQIFGSAPLPLPDFSLAPPMTVHGILSRVLIALLIGHVGAALWHQFFRRDHLLARMGVGR
ncbi:MAG: cytochrome b [Candidatus Devosia phytovorans]|uniref:Cytochrome b n=1 Tax=Candidatus Devosia phytovorans TaxID=3121372 RepID=A0AAJ5VVP3_9HYPH|nr:cytochrome b [Devosia sp.]WEK04264.1 MAG: cytochrome b [Devosia sp.]